MRLLVAALLGTILLSCRLVSAETDTAPFDQLLKSFLESWNKHDAHAFAAIFSADGLITTVGGTRAKGPGEIEKYLHPSFTGPVFNESVYAATIKSARQVRCDVAILDLDWTMTGARTGDGSPRGLRKGTLNWAVVKERGLWKITSYHNAEFPQPVGSRAQ